MRDENPNKKFKSITVLFGILLIVSFIVYFGYNNQDKIKSWFENEDKPEETQQEPYMINDSNSFYAYQITEMMPTFLTLTITILIISAVLIPLFRIFRSSYGNLHTIKKA